MNEWRNEWRDGWKEDGSGGGGRWSGAEMRGGEGRFVVVVVDSKLTN